MTGCRQRRRLQGVVAEVLFDEVGNHMDRTVVGKIVAVNLNDPRVRTLLCAGGGSSRTHDHDALGARQNVVGSITLGHEFNPIRDGGNANNGATGIQGGLLDQVCRCFCRQLLYCGNLVGHERYLPTRM